MIKHLSIKFVILGLVFYASATVLTQFLVAVPLSNLIAGITDKTEVPEGIFPPSIIISVMASKLLASIATAGYIVRHVKTLPLYHALVVGILGAVIGSFINEISPEQAYLAWAVAFCSVLFIVISTYFLKSLNIKEG